jgi:hypothetical protein
MASIKSPSSYAATGISDFCRKIAKGIAITIKIINAEVVIMDAS